MTREYSDVWVCTDCYFAHHYGARLGPDGLWYAGDTDTPCDREPLTRLDDGEISDNTCADHSVEEIYDDDGDRTGDTTACEQCSQTGYEDGIDGFSSRWCDGCNTHLAGSRYRLAYWVKADPPYPTDYHRIVAESGTHSDFD
jgi:ribosomal protein L37AE/L43A